MSKESFLLLLRLRVLAELDEELLLPLCLRDSVLLSLLLLDLLFLLYLSKELLLFRRAPFPSLLELLPLGFLVDWFLFFLAILLSWLELLEDEERFLRADTLGLLSPSELESLVDCLRSDNLSCSISRLKRGQ